MSVYRSVVISVFSVAAAVAMLVGCSTSEHPTDQNQRVDLDDNGVSFSRDIQPIFDNRCTRCHNADLLRGSMDLTADNSYANLVNQPTSAACLAQVPDSVRVVPSLPETSMLWLKTKPANARCRATMPLGMDPLGEMAPEELALMELWIAQGAQNN